jgi:serine/threonine protein kinase
MQSPSRTYLFLEYIDGMELYDFLKGQPSGHVPEDIVRLVTWQLLGALDYMSGKGVLHRDIKLDNVLLNKRGDVKIVRSENDVVFLVDVGLTIELRFAFCRSTLIWRHLWKKARQI